MNKTAGFLAVLLAALVLLGLARVPAQAEKSPSQPFSVRATDFSGADIGEKINEASKAYPQGVRIEVPSGHYKFSTTIKLKRGDALVGVHWGDMDTIDGTRLEYTGDGTAIDLTGNQTYRPVVFLENFRLDNGGQGKYGIYATWATRYFSARNLIINAFETGMYLGDCIINNFTGLHIYNSKKAGIEIRTGYTIQFYSCKIDGGNPGVLINYGNLVSLIGCTFESQRSGHTVVIENGGTGNSLINCYFEDNGLLSDVYVVSKDKDPEKAVRLVSIEGCTFGSKSYCVELDGYVRSATIFRNYLGAPKDEPAVRISSPNVKEVSIGANMTFPSQGPYIENPHRVKLSPIGYLPPDKTEAVVKDTPKPKK
ncbi:MAG: right-handed parallel beta-helix repeat-containing protein [Armatimonadota bacterium]|nr:right-handed parallel beta-helix repeat-containing protein [Armatimonadota bacterium]